ncbi:unnamed protein product [Toxocara canis]|uniref:Actin cortical patch SUR7/pH-response regulator pali n=1 Tax=Toxocara canis TaxID=6265 RepID=A0A183UJE9_TOXCA|nr:unnamed protein product [Toxocara canis]
MDDNDNAKSILIDSVYAPLELPTYSIRGALIMLLVFNGLSVLIAVIWNLVFATFWMSNEFHRYGLLTILHFAVITVTVGGGFFLGLAIAKTSIKLFRLQVLNWTSSAICAIAGTTFLAAGRMECVKWAKFRYFTAHDIDAWKFKTVGCQQQYFVVLAVVNWVALLVHSGALYSTYEYKDSLRNSQQVSVNSGRKLMKSRNHHISQEIDSQEVAKTICKRPEPAEP